jgi:hypothetical protein
MMNEQRSSSFDGTTVGSCVLITQRMLRCRCWRMMPRSDSVRRHEPESLRYCVEGQLIPEQQSETKM